MLLDEALPHSVVLGIDHTQDGKSKYVVMDNAARLLYLVAVMNP